MTSLRPVVPADYPFLYWLSTHEELTFRWRFAGRVPSFERFIEMLWSDVLVQFVVAGPTGDPIGHVVVYQHNLRDGHAYAAVIMDPAHLDSGIGMEAMGLLLDHVFAGWDFRKIYLEASELTFAAFASGVDRFFRVEGCLEDHLYYGGRHWKQYVLAFYRSAFEEVVRPMLARRTARERRKETLR